MTHTGRTLWTELPLHVREYLITEAPEWLILTLQRLRLGTVQRIPKHGQMPADIAKQQVRVRYLALKADGVVPFRRRIEILAHEHQVSHSTVRRWLVGHLHPPDE